MFEHPIYQKISIVTLILFVVIATIALTANKSKSIHEFHNESYEKRNEEYSIKYHNDSLDAKIDSLPVTIINHRIHRNNTRHSNSTINHHNNDKKTNIATTKNSNNNRINKICTDRLEKLRLNAKKSILIHLHIPKAAGTAVSIALTSNCHCITTQSGPDHCTDCKQVYSSKNKHRSYSMSRFSGWECGVHAPLSILRSCSTIKNLPSEGFIPVYIIFLRSPFQRFISETFYWNDYHTPDWSYKMKKPYGHGIELLNGYLSLPQNMMIQNRQIKMIGVGKANFNMIDYKDHIQGTRYQGGTSSKDRIDILNHSINYLSYEAKELFILGLEEKFKESLCILEILYGNLYKFHWSQDSNSHNHNSNFNYTKVTVSEYSRYSNNKILYQKWLENNKEDEILYNKSLYLFDLQFKLALKLINKNKINRKYIPHCKGFINY